MDLDNNLAPSEAKFTKIMAAVGAPIQDNRLPIKKKKMVPGRNSKEKKDIMYTQDCKMLDIMILLASQ